jgi:hypothetical protein
MRALEDEGYEYSSDFGYDYLGLPSFPSLDGRVSKILEIPIFPVAPELFFEKKIFSVRDAVDYYKKAIDEMVYCNLPVIIYAHTSVYYEPVIELLKEITKYALLDKGLRPNNMTGIAGLWKTGIRPGEKTVNLDAKLRVPDYNYLGREANVSGYKIFKRKIKDALDLERIVLIKDFLRNGIVAAKEGGKE